VSTQLLAGAKTVSYWQDRAKTVLMRIKVIGTPKRHVKLSS